MDNVIPKDHSAGNFSHPIRLLMKILAPIKINTTDKAYLIYLKRSIIADRAKYKARKPKIAKIFDV